jgi:serine/threonine protein phosphatase PrpC
VDPFASSISAAQGIPLAAVGMSEDLEPEIVEYRVRPGDWLLFQSDGMPPEVLDHIKLFQLNNPESDLSECQRILAEFQGYSDNVAVSLVGL